MLSHIPRPSLILLDLMMPIMDGWEFMRALADRPDQATIPVAVVTAFTRRTEPVKAVAVLQKPVDLNELFKLAKQYSKQAA